MKYDERRGFERSWQGMNQALTQHGPLSEDCNEGTPTRHGIEMNTTGVLVYNMPFTKAYDHHDQKLIRATRI